VFICAVEMLHTYTFVLGECDMDTK